MKCDVARSGCRAFPDGFRTGLVLLAWSIPRAQADPKIKPSASAVRRCALESDVWAAGPATATARIDPARLSW